MADSPYMIQGNLPFGSGGGGMIGAAAGGFNPQSTDPSGAAAALGQQYQSAYNTALAQNQSNYSNILKGYQQTLANQTGAQQAIGGGYNDLYNKVLGGIADVGKSQSQAIADVYAQQRGATQQSLISRGLGNSTVTDSLQRGNLLDQQKAQVALSNQLAQLSAGYQSQIGGAALNYQNQANMQNTAESNQQLGWMNSVQSNYPNAQAYGGLLSQLGQMSQAALNRQMMQANKPMPMGGGVSGQGAGDAQAAAMLQSRMPQGGGGPSNMASVTPYGMGGGNDFISANFGTNAQGQMTGGIQGVGATSPGQGQGMGPDQKPMPGNPYPYTDPGAENWLQGTGFWPGQNQSLAGTTGYSWGSGGGGGGGE